MNKRSSKRTSKRAPQLAAKQIFFLEALLTMDWLPREIFNAVIRGLGRSPREYQRRVTCGRAGLLWFEVACERARLQSAGKWPYAAGAGTAAIKTLADKHKMSVANVKKMLFRYKPSSEMREFAQVIPLLIDGRFWRRAEELEKARVPEDTSPQFKRIQAIQTRARIGSGF